jgi:hypothetical protein
VLVKVPCLNADHAFKISTLVVGCSRVVSVMNRLR